MLFTSLRLGAAMLCLAGPLHAAEGTLAMTDYVRDLVHDWMAEPEILSAIAYSNARHADLTEEEIIALDARWRGEIGAADAPTIAAVADHEASQRLRDAIAQSQGRVTEIIVMDRRGLNAAISGITSDFWQGDEAKFLETYAAGAGAVHTSEVEFDESTQTYQLQISMPLTAATGALLGAVTVGLNIDAF
ncbi:hypothetical protein ROJ8625_01450 [Roseivivax jejudonensis]|uniref:DUF2059 domain-containing protein n=1 Tax=Roseivivax jejudonensis TaxID=1529041 RepID=A0A1X6YV41_9RHOB|nr:PDC sensor domain-containing protein [Roseivivax jejudonensis]SLN31791.1 hypothetical protein ROJ8625_01450 [Roseivivax jejudonensis]